MRKILLIITIVFLSNLLGFAQDSNTIDSAVFNKLVDYVSCRYVNQYIKKYKKNLNDSIAYESKIRPQLDQCILSKHISYDELYDLLSKNSWGGTANGLVKTWRSKKEFSNVSDEKNSKIIEYIIEINGFNTTIDNNFKETIKGELLAAYPDSVKASYSMVDYKAKYDSLKGIIDSSKKAKKPDVSKDKSERKFNPYEVFQWLIILVLALACIIPKIKNKGKGGNEDETRELIIRTVLDSGRISEQFKPTSINYHDEKFKTVINEIAKKVIEENKKKIESRVIELIKEALKNRDENPIPPQQETSNSDVKYLQEREGIKLFKEVAKENAYYEIFNIQGNIASYRFCGNESRAMSYYDSILKDVFDDEKSYSFKAKRIINGKEGTVELQLDGKWEIKTLAKIKFE